MSLFPPTIYVLVDLLLVECTIGTWQGLRAAYVLLGWFPEDTLVPVKALASLWGGISETNALYRAQRLQKLSLLTKVPRELGVRVTRGIKMLLISLIA